MTNELKTIKLLHLGRSYRKSQNRKENKFLSEILTISINTAMLDVSRYPQFVLYFILFCQHVLLHFTKKNNNFKFHHTFLSHVLEVKIYANSKQNYLLKKTLV